MLAKLERLHMSGPLGNAVTKYLLRGADDISSISLGIEWFDAAFCSTQPDGRSDYMGKEYLVRNKSKYTYNMNLLLLTEIIFNTFLFFPGGNSQGQQVVQPAGAPPVRSIPARPPPTHKGLRRVCHEQIYHT